MPITTLQGKALSQFALQFGASQVNTFSDWNVLNCNKRRKNVWNSNRVKMTINLNTFGSNPFITTRKRSSVCQEFCPGGGGVSASVHAGIPPPLEQAPPEHTPPPEQTTPQTRHTPQSSACWEIR